MNRRGRSRLGPTTHSPKFFRYGATFPSRTRTHARARTMQASGIATGLGARDASRERHHEDLLLGLVRPFFLRFTNLALSRSYSCIEGQRTYRSLCGNIKKGRKEERHRGGLTSDCYLATLSIHRGKNKDTRGCPSRSLRSIYDRFANNSASVR